MTAPQASPVALEERAPALDGLRGIALFGVLVVNTVTLFRVSLFEQLMPPSPSASSTPIDETVARVITIGLEFKAFILFSFLFGVGLAAQRERTTARGVAFTKYAARRLGLLLAIGLAHLFLVWNGDILTLYALTGAVALPLLRLPIRSLAGLALVLFVVQVMPIPWPTPFASFEAMSEHVRLARQVYGFGTFGEVLAFRIHEVRPIAALLLWSVPRTLGLFLLGACAWRSGIFRGERRLLVTLLAVFGIGFGGAAVWAVHSGVSLGTWRDAASGWGATALALGYGAAIVLAFDRPSLASALSLVAPLGRMALTSYLTQSVLLGAIFYGYGLGLFGRLGEARALAIAIAIYVAQAILCALWLRRYRFGPVEWLWRSFTYGARQPLRRGSPGG